MSIQAEPNCTASWVQRVKSGEDSYGNDIYTDTTVAKDAVFAPGGSVEAAVGQEQVTTQPTLYLPAPSPTPVDEVTVNGVTYQVDGVPQDWSAGSPFTGWVPDFPVVVRLKAVTG